MIAPASNDQYLRHESGIADRERLNGVHQGRRSLAQRFHLSLIGLGVGQAYRSNFRSPGGSCLFDVLSLALGFLHPGLGFVCLDVNSNL